MQQVLHKHPLHSEVKVSTQQHKYMV